MAVDVVARVGGPFSAAGLVVTARRLMAELLGGGQIPELAVFVGRRYQQGERLTAGRRLSRRELDMLVVGADLTNDGFCRSGSWLEVEVGVTGDGAWCHFMAFPEDDGPDRLEFICSPYRTCVGVVTAVSVALAAAVCGGGELDESSDLTLLNPHIGDPERAVEAMRLTEPGEDFADQCVRFMRQFDGLKGWPANATRN